MSFCRDLCSGVTGNIRNCMATPLTTKKIGTCCGIIVVLILLIVIISLSIPSTIEYHPHGSEALDNVPLIKGYLNIYEYLTPYYNVSDYNYGNFLKDNSPFDAQVLTTAVHCDAQFKDAVEQTIDQLDFMHRIVSASKKMKLTTTTREITNGKKEGVTSVVLSLGGGHSIDSRTSLLRVYHSFGVRIITIASSDCTNPWVKSLSGDKNNITIYGGDFLKGVVNEMNRLGIGIDVVGTEASFQETVINLSQAPVLMRATALASRRANPFNANDTILASLKKKQGLLMLSMDCSLFSNSTNCTMDEFRELLKEARTKLGSGNIGIGGLVDPKGTTPSNLNFKSLFDKLKEEGWTMNELEGLAGNNFLHFLQQVEKVADNMRTSKPDDTYYDTSKLPNSDRDCYTNEVPSPTSAPTGSPSTTQPTTATTDGQPSIATTAEMTTSATTENASTTKKTTQ